MQTDLPCSASQGVDSTTPSPAMKNLVGRCWRRRCGKMNILCDVVGELRTERIWWEGVDWVERRRNGEQRRSGGANHHQQIRRPQGLVRSFRRLNLAQPRINHNQFIFPLPQSWRNGVNIKTKTGGVNRRLPFSRFLPLQMNRIQRL